MSKRLTAQAKRTPQDIMSENIARDQALKEIERAMGKTASEALHAGRIPSNDRSRARSQARGMV